MILSKSKLDDHFYVGTQMTVADVEVMKQDGFEMIINNRPDDEEDGQPTDAELREAAEKAGMAYVHVPIGRGLGPSDVAAEREALEMAKGKKTFAFCRTGTRSTLIWAAACHEEGTDADTLRAKAEAAGYSLDPIQHLL